MRVLGIDPGYAIVGWGVVDYVGNRFAPVDVYKRQAAVRALQTKKRRHLGTLQPLLVCFFQLIFVQSNAVQQLSLIHI